jgi:hypothetical protein
MVQSDSDAFMSVGPAERKEILARLFDLDRYDDLAERAKTVAAGWQDAVAAVAAVTDLLKQLGIDAEPWVPSVRRRAGAQRCSSRIPSACLPGDDFDGGRLDSDAADREAVVVQRLDVDDLENAGQHGRILGRVGPGELLGPNELALEGLRSLLVDTGIGHDAASRLAELKTSLKGRSLRLLLHGAHAGTRLAVT